MNRLPQTLGLLVLSTVPSAAGGAVADLVDAGRRIPGLVVEMRYAGPDNFVGRRIAGYEAPICLLTPETVRALGAVQAALVGEGLGLKVFDCYRPPSAVADFVRWSRDRADQTAKAAFYPEIAKGDLFRLGYIAARSGHSRGDTVDLTLVDRDGRERDMGTPFDFFGPRSGAGGRVGAEARANRDRLAAAMRRAGFQPYAREWWHFTRPAGGTGRVFDRPVRPE